MSTHAFDRRDPREFGFDAAMEFAPNNMPTPPLNASMPKLNPGFRRGRVRLPGARGDESRTRSLPKGTRCSVP